jgi:ribosome-associated protein
MLKIPYDEFKFSFSRSSGAGGQNVNKVNTKVTLYWDMENSLSLSSSIKKRFKERYSRFIIDSLVVLHSQASRSQSKNMGDAVKKLHDLLQTVEKEPLMRKATKPSKSVVRKRLNNKKLHGEKKKLRQEKF